MEGTDVDEDAVSAAGIGAAAAARPPPRRRPGVGSRGGGAAVAAKHFGPRDRWEAGGDNGVRRYAGPGARGSQPLLSRADMSEPDSFTLYSPSAGRGGTLRPLRVRRSEAQLPFRGKVRFDVAYPAEEDRDWREGDVSRRPRRSATAAAWTVMLFFGVFWVRHNLRMIWARSRTAGRLQGPHCGLGLRLRFTNRYVDVANPRVKRSSTWRRRWRRSR